MRNLFTTYLVLNLILEGIAAATLLGARPVTSLAIPYQKLQMRPADRVRSAP
jgi:hypothetical protein